MMEEQPLDLKDYLGALKRRRLSILGVAAVVFLAGLLTAVLWPPTYRSSATILIKEQDIPPELVRSTVTSYAAQRIQAISQMVMARSNLLEIIKKYGLYKDDSKRLTTEEIIEEMRDNIDLQMIDAEVVDPRSGRPTAATIAFRLSFTGDHPGQVQKVANELTSLYLKENLKERSEKASETYNFLTAESERLSREIDELEEKLAAFKEQHINELPELRELNQTLMDRTERELSDIDSQIRSLEERKIYLGGQLAQLKPFGTDVSVDPKTRLQALRTEYLRLKARYSEDHPDVIRAKREIEALEAETGDVDTSAERMKQIEALKSELAQLRKRYSPEHPDVVKLRRQIDSLQRAPVEKVPGKLATAAGDNPDNPAYISLKSQIEAADSEIRSLKKKKEELRARLREYENRLVQTPQVEREYLALNRDLQNATAKYQEIRAKQMEAQVSQQLEKERKGERFELIEPAILPEEPVSPNRPAIIFLSLVLALGAGIGYAAIAEGMDDSVRGGKSLLSAVGAPPLAEIPYQATEEEVRGHKRKVALRTAAAVGIVVLALALAHFFWKPLDVLWYKALRKADVVINT